jgi:RNA recognition motif-containing protein
MSNKPKSRDASKRRRASDEKSQIQNVDNADKRVEKKTVDEPDSDEDDDDLLAAAAQWAKQQSDSADPTEQEHITYSLHVTQLSFDVKEYDIRTLFETNGCVVTSVRKVYDRSGNAKTFRGVAFVDVSGKASYEKALSLDRRVLHGRRINVRPTKTKEELADIVERTKNLVAEKIRLEREKQDAAKAKGETAKNDSPKGDKKPSGKRRSRDGEVTSNRKSKKSKTSGAEAGNKSDDVQKLSKKERNRRAAIIMNRRRGK